ncbi:phosphate/phosphite/phosphonate ABC transporter substrate-binding protein [Paraburkholderia sp. DHOC27]|uniref:phosphate/phosphite/phosphonate ABC transporter substrate-binding protein n=1 Tax=Paraburkholderia sp. DHOC27 TaxID=2303330 RepID=UPI000E3CA5A3|nr:PhnD/SsuA/transferrin family substrate-binding protein [Paraburkholderia sp. DHOC27]RFU44798.1 phosphate ABC transporter substrate-binding protein [Paraburkholderia sp. DHOC27]
MTWIAALPMYNVTPTLAADWRAWLGDVLRAVDPQTQIVEPGDDLHALWRRSDLLISQTCGYPLVTALSQQVQLIATPHFDAPGCSGANYSSALVTHADAPFETLAACRGARAAYNQDDSNSGMNVFRHAVAPLAREGRFFGATLRTGSHLGSLRAVAQHQADVAAIDCVTYAFVCDALPELAQQVRVLGWTAASPGLPLIAARDVPQAKVEALRATLHDSLKQDPQRAARLRLSGFSVLSLSDYARITQLENEARALGYPTLA